MQNVISVLIADKQALTQQAATCIDVPQVAEETRIQDAHTWPARQKERQEDSGTATIVQPCRIAQSQVMHCTGLTAQGSQNVLQVTHNRNGSVLLAVDSGQHQPAIGIW